MYGQSNSKSGIIFAIIVFLLFMIVAGVLIWYVTKLSKSPPSEFYTPKYVPKYFKSKN